MTMVARKILSLGIILIIYSCLIVNLINAQGFRTPNHKRLKGLRKSQGYETKSVFSGFRSLHTEFDKRKPVTNHKKKKKISESNLYNKKRKSKKVSSFNSKNGKNTTNIARTETQTSDEADKRNTDKHEHFDYILDNSGYRSLPMENHGFRTLTVEHPTKTISYEDNKPLRLIKRKRKKKIKDSTVYQKNRKSKSKSNFTSYGGKNSTTISKNETASSDEQNKRKTDVSDDLYYEHSSSKSGEDSVEIKKISIEHSYTEPTKEHSYETVEESYSKESDEMTPYEESHELTPYEEHEMTPYEESHETTPYEEHETTPYEEHELTPYEEHEEEEPEPEHEYSKEKYTTDNDGYNSIIIDPPYPVYDDKYKPSQYLVSEYDRNETTSVHKEDDDHKSSEKYDSNTGYQSSKDHSSQNESEKNNYQLSTKKKHYNGKAPFFYVEDSSYYDPVSEHSGGGLIGYGK